MSELTSISFIEEHIHTFSLLAGTDGESASLVYSLQDDMAWATSQFNKLAPDEFGWIGSSSPLKELVELRRDEGEFRTTFTQVLTLACATPYLWDAEEEPFELNLAGMLGKMWRPILDESTAPHRGKPSRERYLRIRRLWSAALESQHSNADSEAKSSEEQRHDDRFSSDDTPKASIPVLGDWKYPLDDADFEMPF